MNGFAKKQGKGAYMKYCFIINPRAGKGAFVEELEKDIATVYAKEYFSCFPLSFIVSGLMFRSLIYLEFIFE